MHLKLQIAKGLHHISLHIFQQIPQGLQPHRKSTSKEEKTGQKGEEEGRRKETRKEWEEGRRGYAWGQECEGNHFYSVLLIKPNQTI